MCPIRKPDSIINRSLIARLRLAPRHNDLINPREDLPRNCEGNNNGCDRNNDKLGRSNANRCKCDMCGNGTLGNDQGILLFVANVTVDSLQESRKENAKSNMIISFK